MKFLYFHLFLILFIACKKETNNPKSSLNSPLQGPRVNKTREIFFQNNHLKSIYNQHYNYYSDGRLDFIDRNDSTISGGVWLVQTYSIMYTYYTSKRLKNIFYSAGAGINLQFDYAYDNKGKLLYSITQQSPQYPDTTFYFHLSNGHCYSKRTSSVLSLSYYSHNLDSTVSTNIEGGALRGRMIYRRNTKTDLIYQYTNAYEPIVSENNERVKMEMFDYGLAPPPSYYYYTYERIYNEKGYPVLLTTYLNGNIHSVEFINYD